MTVLNYIVEIFVPIADVLNKENNFSEKYTKIQKQYFYLIKMEDDFLLEGKDRKFEQIAENHNFFQNNMWDLDVEKIILNEKKEEFLKNLKNEKEFLEIFEKYGNIELYKTYVKLFEWLDNFGEDGLLEKLKKELEEMKNSDELIKYKTEKVLLKFDKNENIGFIDFYIMNENKIKI